MGQYRPPELSELTRTDWAVATFSLTAIALHDFVHVAAGRYPDVFWICNVAAALIAPGILLRSPLLSAAALTWLVPGTVVWLLDAVLAKSNILPTSYAVHLGGTLAAVYATRRNGHHPRGWLAALSVIAAAALVSRLFLPPRANVNVAHAVPRGWGFLGGTWITFAPTVLLLVLLICFLGSRLGRFVANAGRPRAYANTPVGSDIRGSRFS